MKKHWRNLIQDQKYLGSWDLEQDGKYVPVVVTIENIYVGDFTSQGGTEKKPFVKLKEFNKPMVLQVDNFNRLENFFKSFDYNDYKGKQIMLGVESVKFRGSMTNALRFSSRPLPQSKAKPVITDDKFPAALEAVRTGAMTIDKVKEMYEVTPAQLKALNEV